MQEAEARAYWNSEGKKKKKKRVYTSRARLTGDSEEKRHLRPNK